MVLGTLCVGRLTLPPVGGNELDEFAAILRRPSLREWWGALWRERLRLDDPVDRLPQETSRA